MEVFGFITCYLTILWLIFLAVADMMWSNKRKDNLNRSWLYRAFKNDEWRVLL